MAQEQPPISEADKAFIQKLGQFRTTLSADERQMLDALVLAAHGVRRDEVVSGYQQGAGRIAPPWFYGDDRESPRWYTGQIPTPGMPPLAWWFWWDGWGRG